MRKRVERERTSPRDKNFCRQRERLRELGRVIEKDREGKKERD